MRKHEIKVSHVPSSSVWNHKYLLRMGVAWFPPSATNRNCKVVCRNKAKFHEYWQRKLVRAPCIGKLATERATFCTSLMINHWRLAPLTYSVQRRGLSMSLDDKLKNYAKYQLDYERSNALRKALLWMSLITIAAAILLAIYVLDIWSSFVIQKNRQVTTAIKTK